MSSFSTSVVGAGEVGGYRPQLFTAVQFQELEHQAMIYKYLVAGLPVPPDLKFDPEPGRCRRTDGKKWRCAKDVYPDSKYCERHMHRGRNRSRKPVESQSTSQSLATAVSHCSTGNINGTVSVPASGSGSFKNIPPYPVSSSEILSFGSHSTKLQVEPSLFAMDNKEYRYIQGMTPATDDYKFSIGTPRCNGGPGMNSSQDNTWNILPSSSSLQKSNNDTLLPETSTQVHIYQTFEASLDLTASNKSQQHCFFGSGVGMPESVKQEQLSMRTFFDEWPATRESCHDVENESSHEVSFSTTQLSISTPMAPHESSARGAYDP
ncbi:hypothetical protein Leryth_015134 [Lithospermum erythrorhizon]|nr:hypothetical protein Leryth_015134 [Lithospermum erythrorhizon]